MRTNTRLLNETYGKLYAERFIGRRSCYVRFHLNGSELGRRNVIVRGFSYKDEVAEKIARKFCSCLSRFYYGNAARRYGRKADMTIALHKGRFFDGNSGAYVFSEVGNWHLHIVAEVPDHKTFDEVKDCVLEFVAKNAPLTVPQSKSNADAPALYFAETRDEVAAQIYNTRFGTDSVLFL
jgi:hypothetical protein